MAGPDRAFELKVERQARRFELRPLLALLRSRGYRRDEILFESSGGGSSPSIVEAVSFVPGPPRRVLVTLNIGLLGDSSLLPSYFFEVIERTRDPDRFYDFIRFFDHRLIDALVRGLYPEDDDRVFRDWGEAKRSFVRMLGVGSPSTLRWLAGLYFPELGVHVERRPFSSFTDAHAFRAGSSTLDGAGVLGRTYESEASGLVLDLIAEEETDARGNGWAGVVRGRLRDQLLPVLEPFRLPLAVRLTVLSHASWARLEAREGARGYLGYDRLRDEGDSGHTIVLYVASQAGEGA